MTYKEKWCADNPGKEFVVRQNGCPNDRRGKACIISMSCEECWNREIPEEDATLTFEHQGKPIAKVESVTEEND